MFRLVLVLCLLGLLSVWVVQQRSTSVTGSEQSGVVVVPKKSAERGVEEVQTATVIETRRMTFREVLGDETLSRNERIAALTQLDPGALRGESIPNTISSKTPKRSAPKNTKPKPWELAEARRRVQITMYSTSWCGACKHAKAYFDKERIRYVERDVEKDEAARALHRRLNPKRTVPTIVIDEELLVGFSPNAFEAARSRAIATRSLR